jgi:hypothetical protein
VFVCAALAAGLLAGCGGDGPSDAEQVVDSYLQAIADGDGEKACEHLTEAVQRQLIDAAPAELGAGDCPAAAEAIAGALTEQQRRQLRDTQYGEVTVDGDRATVPIQGGGTVQLTKTGSGAYEARSWQISGGLELDAAG